VDSFLQNLGGGERILAMLLYFLLSVIPGLGHVPQRRVRDVRWYIVAWIGLVGCALLSYGTSGGVIMLGLAAALHAWIALDAAGLIGGRAHILRMALFLSLMGMLIVQMYRGIGTLAFSDLVIAPSSLAVPALRVQQGDYLLARHSSATPALLKRGSLVFVPASSVVNHGAEYGTQHRGPLIVGQIVGLPGDTAQINEGVFQVNGKVVDSQKFPIPAWMKGAKLTIVLPAGTYFVTSEYNLNFHGNININNVMPDMIRNVCCVRLDDIRGRVSMKWLPIWQRSRLKEIE
jgi:signal peptidase I